MYTTTENYNVHFIINPKMVINYEETLFGRGFITAHSQSNNKIILNNYYLKESHQLKHLSSYQFYGIDY